MSKLISFIIFLIGTQIFVLGIRELISDQKQVWIFVGLLVAILLLSLFEIGWSYFTNNDR